MGKGSYNNTQTMVENINKLPMARIINATQQARPGPAPIHIGLLYNILEESHGGPFTGDVIEKFCKTAGGINDYDQDGTKVIGVLGQYKGLNNGTVIGFNDFAESYFSVGEGGVEKARGKLDNLYFRRGYSNHKGDGTMMSYPGDATIENAIMDGERDMGAAIQGNQQLVDFRNGWKGKALNGFNYQRWCWYVRGGKEGITFQYR